MRPEQDPARPARVVPALHGAVTVVAALLAAAGVAACTTGSGGSGATSHAATSTPATPPTTPASTPDASTTLPGTQSAPGPSLSAPVPSDTTPTKTRAPRQVSLVVTYSGWDAKTQQAEVDAFTPDVLAADATCTLTLTKSAITRTASKHASTGPSSTQCGALIIPGSQLSAGTWTAVVTFTSAKAVGHSQPVHITVTG